mgnify:CR=1 FL=1
MLKLGILASGNGSNLQAIIDAIETKRLDAEIRVVISDNPNAYALERAKKHSIKTAIITKEKFPKKENFDAELAAALKESNVELVVLAGFMRILSPIVIKMFPPPKAGVMNIHPSLLPSFPGLDAQKKALDYGVKFSGCTVHFVDDGVDTGPIITQAVVSVKEGDTVETLSKRILSEEHRIYPEAIRLFSEGRLVIQGRRVSIKN